MNFGIFLGFFFIYTIPHVRVKMGFKKKLGGGGGCDQDCIEGVTDKCVKNSMGGSESLRR